MNAAKPEQVKKAENRTLSVEQRQQMDLQLILESVEGRRFVWRYLKFCGIFERSYVSTSHSETCFNEGMRNVGLKLLAEVNETDPESYLEMMKEHRE